MSDQEIQNLLRRLPAVGALIEELRRRLPEESGTDTELLTYLARRRIADRRSALLEGSGQGEVVDPAVDLDGLADELARDLAAWRRGSSTCRVVNATGILLHSGLGRAVLPPAALDAVARADGYVLLEVDRRDGKRRKRDAFLEELLCHLTGAEAALVVNNNAAATILILASMAAGKNVVVSRSQMVEIGGSYRLPDVMEASGCLLREVGTTNRSYGEDYEGAVDEQTGALLLVHTSNYRLVGFTRHVEIREMVEIGRRVGKPVIHDLGSGCLVDAAALGLRHLALGEEPPVRESVAAGADVICFSGDKILGGAQAGIVVGKKEWIERIRKHPLARAMRIDKLTCIALEAVLKLYLEPSKLVERIPTLTMLEESPESVAERARTLAER